VVSEDRGRIVKFIGDAALIESPSAEAAVMAADEVRGLLRAGESIRTGIHLGDGPANTFTRDATKLEPRPRGSVSAAYRCDVSAVAWPLAHVWREARGAVAVECALPPHAVAAIRLEIA
jgi:hypothetical protein